MPERMSEKVIRICKQQANIRNVSTSAHIHHGKTAFTDNLIAAAGMMSQEAAGDLEKGMMTWQHADEQERLLTVDAASVSMVHTYQNEEYLINLIDTPGHVDFGGNVTSAMRAVDGTVVLVCASEGIMPQTETVLKQALRERVKPVLFINKTDRLITEIKLTPEQMQERFIKIITEFNRLIERIAEKGYGEQWKVNVNNGSVAFGSARENWALSIPYMQKKNVTFKEIIDIYRTMEGAERDKALGAKAPLYEVILDMVIKHLPSPVEAQKYRVPKIWHGDPLSAFGQSLVNCDAGGKPAFAITKINIDKLAGEISIGRLFSGALAKGMEVYLNRAKQRQRIQNVFVFNGIKREITDAPIPCGNIIALGGIKASVGETITLDPEEPFGEIVHIFEPVITKAIEALKPSDLPKLVEVLRQVAKEDPTIIVEIHEETGEHLLHGMGELHLEIIENRIKTEKGVEVKTSSPIVVYRETITKASSEVEGKSPNKHNKFYFTVEPLEEGVYQAIKETKIPEGRIKKKDVELRDKLIDAGMERKEADQVKDIFKGNMFIDATRGQVYAQEVMELVLDMFEDVMNKGPLAREPCIKLKVRLTDMSLHEDAIHRGPAQVYPAIRDGIRGAMMLAGPVLFEPLQVLLLEAPIDHMGGLSKLVASKRGQLLEMSHEAHEVVIKAKIPVMELIGWSSDLRSETEGRGVSSLYDQMFERMPIELQQKVIAQIRSRKGLSEAQ
ncbi:elongation factor EF-2 [Candidatus Woesearchaeota archaeon]|nr:elongation factor EF-2 [Candidatus Woesearchaeota archaeon]